jgi:hypothetical protein
MKIFPVRLIDHLDGFDVDLNNRHLVKFDNYASNKNLVGDTVVSMFIDDTIKQKYSNLNFIFTESKYLWQAFDEYNTHPLLRYKNFLCSFNGSPHVGRQILAAILNNQGFFDPEYSSKNFAYDDSRVISHLQHLDLSIEETRLYSKFFSNPDSFNSSVYSFGHDRFNHGKNIYNLESKLTQSFLHLVSETLSTSYYPFVSEKFLYSIVTRGLFLAYAQPSWHQYIQKYYGFKLYDSIFDYSFDGIKNPVKRLVRLIESISKFSNLSSNDWTDLYLIEQDKIEYNYNHFFSGDYRKHIAQFIECNYD